MSQMRLIGLAAALGATFVIAGCPSDDDDNDSNATLSTTVAMTMTATDTTPGTTTEVGSESGGSSSSGTPMTDLTAADMQVIWDAGCVTDCHEAGATGSTAWPSLPLTADVAYENLVDADGLQTMAIEDLKLVVPSDVENSYLLYKLRGTHVELVGVAGASQMPLSRTDPTMSDPLPDATIDQIEEWIAGGAPEE